MPEYTGITIRFTNMAIFIIRLCSYIFEEILFRLLSEHVKHYL